MAPGWHRTDGTGPVMAPDRAPLTTRWHRDGTGLPNVLPNAGKREKNSYKEPSSSSVGGQSGHLVWSLVATSQKTKN